jgi:hypothetical protein
VRDADGRPRLTAKAFQDVMTAFLAHDGAQFPKLHVRVVGHRVEPADEARLFAWFESTTTHPWTLVVERVLNGEVGDRATTTPR